MSNRIKKTAFSLVELVVVISLVVILIGLLLSAVQKIRSTAARANCQSNLKQIALALQQYHDTHSRFPQGCTYAPNEKYQYLGWTARILPFIEENNTWTLIMTTFDNDPNPKDFTGYTPQMDILAKPIRIFGCPSDSRTPGPLVYKDQFPVSFTSYLGIEGLNQVSKDGILFADSNIKLIDVNDGTSNTLLAGERPPSADLFFGWWYRGMGQSNDGSGDMVLGAREKIKVQNCTKLDTHFQQGQFSNQCDLFHYWSPHSGGANFAFADGSVRFLLYEADEILPALATRAGGESVSLVD